MAVNLSWHAKVAAEDTYEQIDELFAGTVSTKQDLRVSFQIWNNKGGQEDMDDFHDFAIMLFFENSEDTNLLKYCRAIVNKTTEVSLQLIDDYALIRFPMPVILKGTKNNGIDIDNKNHWMTIDFIFHTPEGLRLKENDLKSLYFKIVDADY